MEDDKKSCCGLSKVGKVGRAVIIGCGIFAILLVGFSCGARFNHTRGINNFQNDKYNRFEGGCRGNHVDRGREGGRGMQNQAGGCGMNTPNITPAAGTNFERQINKNGIQSDAIVVPSVVTSTDTIIK